jgi:hypothetical protein
MNQDVKKRWVEALRSGKYQQGRGHLCDGSTYCCLGVLCELVVPEMKILRVGLGFSYGHSLTCLPREANERSGVAPETEEILIEMNDGNRALGVKRDTGKKTFAEIADWIEENL